MHRVIYPLTAGLLTILTTSLTTIPTRAQISPPSTPGSSGIVDRFQCNIPSIGGGEISLRGNGYYNFKQENGKYENIAGGYRFLSSSLRGQSAIRYKKDIYIFPTSDEAKAIYLINNNEINSCQTSEPAEPTRRGS